MTRQNMARLHPSGIINNHNRSDPAVSPGLRTRVIKICLVPPLHHKALPGSSLRTTKIWKGPPMPHPWCFTLTYQVLPLLWSHWHACVCFFLTQNMVKKEPLPFFCRAHKPHTGHMQAQPRTKEWMGLQTPPRSTGWGADSVEPIR